MKSCFALGAGLALTALAAPVAAQVADANADCISEEEVGALAIYAMPRLIAAARQSCSNHLSASGFLATGGDTMAQRYAAEGSLTWPQARIALLKLGGAKGSEDLKVLTDLPDEAVRPLMDALIEQKVAEEVKPGSCTDIERLANALAPLEPAEVGTLVGVIVGMTVDDKPEVCPVRES